MVSAVRSRPSHYETLGLGPTASNEEIARAFVKEIHRPRAFGGIAEVSIAYETLRDPAKRRAYDASLGPKPGPVLGYSLTARGGGAQFIGSAPGRPVEQRIDDQLPPPAPPMKPQLRPEPPAEPRTASFIAASLREPVEPVPLPGPQPERLRRPEPEAKPGLDPRIGGDRGHDRAEKPRLGDAEDRPVQWQRTAISVGAVVVAVGLLGALAGWQAGHGEGPQQPERGVTAALPPPKPLAATIAPPPAPARSVAEAYPQRLPRAAAAAARIKRISPPPQPTAPEQPLSEATQSEASQPEGTAPSPAVAESPPAQTAESPPARTVAANMALPNAVIARTIGRIGYACGRVVSTTAVAGEAPGVFKVTCTSGHSYQAKPVRGRYHFRRWGSH